MEFMDVIAGRRSIRKYKADPVEKEKIQAVLNAARLAPSWKNMQCWKFMVLESQAGKEAVLQGFADDNPGKKALVAAPVLLVICGDPKFSGVENEKDYYLVDLGIAFEHVILAAHDQGLGTCFMGMFDEEVVKKNLKVPADWRVVGVTPLGYPDQEPKARPRNELKDIVFGETWGSQYIK